MAARYLALLVAALWAVPAAAAPLGFDKPVYVDQHLAGGEPVLLTDTVHHDIIYSTHEGTTHIYRPGLASSTTFDFASGYRNQVNVWTSRDQGRTWKGRRLRRQVHEQPGAELGLQRPRPHTGPRRARLQHRHQPRQRLAVQLQRRRHDVGPWHRAVPRRRPPVARRRQEGRRVPGHQRQRGRPVPPDTTVAATASSSP